MENWRGGFTSTNRVSRSLAASTSPSGETTSMRYLRVPAVLGTMGSRIFSVNLLVVFPRIHHPVFHPQNTN